MRRSAAVTILLLATAASVQAAQVTLTGDKIPAYYPVGTSILFRDSDSLYLNDRLLVRDVEYRFDRARGAFDLSQVHAQPADTLTIVYAAAPSWMTASFGRPLPEIVPKAGETPSEAPVPRRLSPADPMSGLSLSGAKSFRFNARSAGSSDFSQTLDLTVSGELTPGLTIRGAVSDRGYDPSYGTANSRLNELNKINLELESQRFNARIGDIEITNRLPVLQSRSKRIAGAWMTVRDPSWYVEATAARPKGLSESVRFFGDDGVQGPYRIGSRSTPIVPGSETVWLDGGRLERGSNNDYVMDYPAGTITFNVNHAIDRRRRIEIDFEPQAADYREELFNAGGGIALRDSTFLFETGWLREGDDRDEPLIGELSEADRGILAGAGDSTGLTFRSGVSADTAGDYVLLADNLPDTVYQYVGEDAGEYAITFSYVGSVQGSYRNLGSNRFEYAGPGNGEYLPVIILAAPERMDQYVARGKWRTEALGEVSAEYRHSQSDQNLFSRIDDADNAGDLYALGYSRHWGNVEQEDSVGVRSRFRDATYRTRERLYEPEFNRNHHLPVDYRPLSDEWWHEGSLSLSPIDAISLVPSASLLRYSDKTEALRGGMRLRVRPAKKIEIGAGGQVVNTDLATADGFAHGEATIADGMIEYRPGGTWRLAGGLEFDDRTNNYADAKRGTRFTRWHTEIGRQTERVRVEHYVEDSLMQGWAEALRRTRLELHSSRRLGDLSYTSMLAHQWLDQPDIDERSFMGRLNLQYSNVRSRLTVSAGYLLSEETRNVRGLTFLEVERGRGDYIFEDSQYVPDPNGNFIRVEEILSDRSPVSRGEKSFYLSKDWRFAVVRFTSRIDEELLEQGERSFWWGLPFYSDPDQAYQFFNARHTGELRFIPIRNAHAVNIEASQNRELRTIAGSNRERRDRKGTLTFKQAAAQTHFEQSFSIFDADRDAYYTGAGIIDGWQADVIVRQLVNAHEFRVGTGYRRASSEDEEESQQYLVRGGMRLAVVNKGELRADLEVYRQELTGVTGLPSYTLTENRFGARGADWTAELRYGLRKDFRLSMSISGRHSDDRTGRVTARGEMVAGF